MGLNLLKHTNLGGVVHYNSFATDTYFAMTKMIFVCQTYVESSDLPKQYTCGKQHNFNNFLRYYKKNTDTCAHAHTNF